MHRAGPVRRPVIGIWGAAHLSARCAFAGGGMCRYTGGLTAGPISVRDGREEVDR
jgi:hypothetical protein